MWAESEGIPGRGSAFHFTLVTRAAAETAPDADAAPQPGTSELDPEQASRHPLRILLVEDNAVNQKLALRSCRSWGIRRTSRETAIEAVEAVERQEYDLVLMDVQMPEMDGLEATRRIRARVEGGPRIVAMTANAMDGDREACLEAGMDDYVGKPIRVDELVAALARDARQIGLTEVLRVPSGDERLSHPAPLGFDGVQALAHGLEVARSRRRLRLQAERGEPLGSERAGVPFQRVRRSSSRLGLAGRRRLSQSLELARRLLDELVDQLGDERRIVAHACAQLVQCSRVERALRIRHSMREPS